MKKFEISTNLSFDSMEVSQHETQQHLTTPDTLSLSSVGTVSKTYLSKVLLLWVVLVQEFLDRRKMTEFGSLALVDEGSGEGDGVHISLPGVRRGTEAELQKVIYF